MRKTPKMPLFSLFFGIFLCGKTLWNNSVKKAENAEKIC